MLLTTHSGSVTEIREQTAPPEGSHLWHINLEGEGRTLPNPDESRITSAANIKLRRLWFLLVASFAQIEKLAWTHLQSNIKNAFNNDEPMANSILGFIAAFEFKYGKRGVRGRGSNAPLILAKIVLC